MLNALLKRLDGHAIEASSLSEALGQLGRDREAALAEIKTLQSRRKQALLDDASDAVLDKIERDIDRANVRLEKIALAEGPLRERLAQATQAERQKRWQAHLADFQQRAQAFLGAARATIAAHDALLEVRAAAVREGYPNELRTLPLTPSVGGVAPVCATDLLALFEDALAPRRPIAAVPSPTPAKPTRSAPRSGDNVRVMLSTGSSIQPLERLSITAPPLPDDIAPLEAGQVRAIVVQRGYTTPTGQQCQAGRRIRLSAAVAREAALNGAVEIVEVS